MKFIHCLYLLFGLLFFNAGVLHAEGECPPGMFPTNPPGTQGPVGCAPIPGYNQQQQPQQQNAPTPPLWDSRWGAIAMDESTQHGGTGASVNQPTRLIAEQSALENCRSNGGANCNIKSTYDNECVAIVTGNPGGNTVTDITQNKATEAAMRMCTTGGNTNCHVYYTACSLPVRIN